MAAYLEDYMKAHRLGMKAAQTALCNGESPNLPVLSEQVSNLDALSHIPMGVCEIPLEWIKGTVTSGRTSAFACNFMPLLEAGTEFSAKWCALYGSVLQDGIRDAVKAVEYMGEYYLLEGNKRVCVAKYLDMEFIDADVTRIMPAKDSSPRVIAYYEYCAFSKETGLTLPIFTKPGQYEKLKRLLRRPEGQPWTERERKDFNALYRYFYVSYHKVMEKNEETIPVNDAFLAFLVAYGYTEVAYLSQDVIEEKIKLMKQEFIRMGGEEATNLIMKKEAPFTFLPSFLLPSAVKAAFLFVSPVQDSCWNYCHELGRINAQNALEGKLETRAVIISSRDQFSEEIQKLIDEDFHLFFATSPVMLNSCIAPSLENPDITIYCASPVSSYQKIRSYYLRFYEAKFLLGMAAGMYARNGKIGYVADYPIIGVASSINAFAKGAAMVNPMAKISLEWSCKENFDSQKPFADPEIEVICNRDINAPAHSSLEYGLYMKHNGELRNLGALLPDWSQFYTHFAEQYLKDRLDGDDENAALSYWWGMSSGALDTVLSTHFDLEAARLIRHFATEIQEERFHVFEGEWKNQAGEFMCEAGHQMSPAEILCMDQLASNIIGGYPSLEELTAEARPVVKLQGRGGELQPDVRSFRW